jgi:hypothetical protein
MPLGINEEAAAACHYGGVLAIAISILMSNPLVG